MSVCATFVVLVGGFVLGLCFVVFQDPPLFSPELAHQRYYLPTCVDYLKSGY